MFVYSRIKSVELVSFVRSAYDSFSNDLPDYMKSRRRRQKFIVLFGELYEKHLWGFHVGEDSCCGLPGKNNT
jgi:hypothetical protein